MESLITLIIAIVLMLMALIIVIKLVLPGKVFSRLVSSLLSESIVGIWHFIFGARKVRIEHDRKKRALGVTKKRK